MGTGAGSPPSCCSQSKFAAHNVKSGRIMSIMTLCASGLQSSCDVIVLERYYPIKPTSSQPKTLTVEVHGYL